MAFERPSPEVFVRSDAFDADSHEKSRRKNEQDCERTERALCQRFSAHTGIEEIEG
jgi:hypothetical protein